MDKEVRQILDIAEQTPGIEVSYRKDHAVVANTSPGFSDPRIQGNRVYVHYTPDRRGRNFENIKSKLRAVGVDVPHKGGKRKGKKQ